MNRSYSKLRHIQESNIIFEQRKFGLINEQSNTYFICERDRAKFHEILKDDAINIGTSNDVFVSTKPCRKAGKSVYGPGSSIYVHTVEGGENLTNIIKKYKTASDITPEVVAKINDITNLDEINIGQKIIIPNTIR